ncbi:SpoIIE family protein phosphatase [Streptomyces sp. AV19]|uniref:SpoIIE family protein phosphatase n=1 Tax=Streptomyces sp. AV19 TaxID=2793068 RepID=UPI0018FEAD2A|nr:SpoIIE family protein phosphatase [Streptomyces sp. AV19]MBH1934504.1 SpoIIE family protein phosphatase [Streptomyces sp. AV19]MDG4533298.1 SpoIIE family protein phosphatase [Streptomyces sp. AV19]
MTAPVTDRTFPEPRTAPGTATGRSRPPVDVVRTLTEVFLDAPVGLAVLDAEGVEWAANARWEQLLGGRRTEGAMVPWTDRLPAADRDRAARAVTSAFALPARDAVLVRLTGLRLTVRALGTPGLCVAAAEADDGTPDAEHSEREAQLRLALEIVDLAAWSVDADTLRHRWFAGSEKLYGITPGPAGEGIEEVIAPEDLEAATTAFYRAVDGIEPLDIRCRLAAGDKAGRWLRVKARTYMLGDPPRRTLVGVTRDITDTVHHEDRLRARADNAADRADRIQDLATTLLSATTTDEVARAVADHFCASTDAIGALVVVPEDGRLRTMAGSGTGVRMGALMDGTPLDRAGATARVMREGKALYVRSRAEMRELSGGDPHHWLDHTRARSWALLPLTHGALLFGYAREHDFPVTERTLLLALAGLTSQAMERCGLVQARIDLASAVQRALLPEELPDLPGLRLAARYSPARDGVTVGGDWYDAVRLPDGRCALVIGDVEGHDVEAAATMGQVRTAVRAYARTRLEPSEVLAHANALLCSLDTSLFTTCTYAVVDRGRGELTAATAGHVPALLGLADGTTRPLAPRPGPPLGILPTASYPTLRVPLDGARWLALLTDGLLEGPDLELDAGVDRLRHSVPADAGDDPARLADALLEAAASTGHRDDAAVLTACLEPAHP